ncbi:hypothetical protein IG631_18330 [Alternaria alternata]|jgi:hypothetical protein|nr:hypothetical protein IG631_18330 [Alternaria alternata]
MLGADARQGTVNPAACDAGMQACTTRQRQEATAAYIKSCSPLSAGIIAMQQADDWPTAPLRCAGTGRNGGGCCSRVGCVAGDILTSPR